ncbi:hypothetical protein BCR43DRAFT_496208 [Syncephalastrum racemosum]|uniref:Uncharacterized protein n=1 Tax=Syncephalastrum racemosum TaxID=13706 RepID=A0A1X2H3P4_SYNRA|nr:hypothetical protein BCR43DRAFT_496208 [Syncephalastrum racemosum]
MTRHVHLRNKMHLSIQHCILNANPFLFFLFLPGMIQPIIFHANRFAVRPPRPAENSKCSWWHTDITDARKLPFRFFFAGK